jgi:flagellar hook-associated protein 2
MLAASLWRKLPMAASETSMISLNDYLNQYTYYLRQRVSTLEAQKSELTIKYAIYTDLNSKLTTLEDAVERLSESGSSSVFRSKTVASSNDSVVTAFASGSAVSGTHTVFVSQLARAHSVVSNRYGQEGTSLSGSNSGERAFSITVDGETYDVSVSISAGESDLTVLSNIATAINEATDGEAMASCVMDTPSTCKISILSGSSGTAGTMTFTDTGGLLSALGVTNSSQATDTVGGYVYADLGGNELDALLTVDGISVVSSTNTVENVIQGMTITLLAEQEAGDAAVNLTASIDVEGIVAEVEDFLTAYNETYTFLLAKTSVDGVTYERGPLSSEYPYITLRNNMRLTMNTFVNETTSEYSALSQIGITSDRSGNFSISDASLLQEVISSDPEVLESLFASTGGIATGLAALLDGYTTPGGRISSSQTAMNSKMSLLDDGIERQEAYIKVREASLRKQFSALQEALYALQMSQAIAASYASLLGL